MKRIPYHDSQLEALCFAHGEWIEPGLAWLKGWDTANLAAPIENVNEELVLKVRRHHCDEGWVVSVVSGQRSDFPAKEREAAVSEALRTMPVGAREVWVVLNPKEGA